MHTYLQPQIHAFMKILKKLTLAAALLLSHLSGSASDSLSISLLTCTPGPVIYEQYGHTAIRVKSDNQDIVFNYGVFSFDEPFFAFRFAQGKTNYLLGVEYFKSFVEAYNKRGSFIYSQEILLPQEDLNNLYSMLMRGSMPANREYRYNIFYKNCTTCALDIIYKAAGKDIQYPALKEDFTTRDYLHKYNDSFEYSKTGIDLILGADADTVLSTENSYFLPMEAMILAQEDSTLFAGAEILLTPDKPMVIRNSQITPAQLALLVLLVIILLCMMEWYRGNIWWGIDIALFGLQGLVGIIIMFMVLFSEHPATDANYLLIVLNPVPLCFLPAIIIKLKREELDYFLIVEALVAFGFIIIQPFLPQYIDKAVIVLTAAIAIRSISDVMISFFAKKIVEKRKNYIKQRRRVFD